MADEHARKNNLKIKFEYGDALNMKYDNGSFEQIIAAGVLFSHFPDKSMRNRVLSEIYRVLAPDGVLLINAHNIYRDKYLQLVKMFMKFIRLFGNPYRYGANDIPRLGAMAGKPDLFFFRKNKSTLHYFYPLEFLSDLLAARFSIIDCNIVPRDDNSSAERNLFYKQPWIMTACKKQTIKTN